MQNLKPEKSILPTASLAVGNIGNGHDKWGRSQLGHREPVP